MDDITTTRKQFAKKPLTEQATIIFNRMKDGQEFFAVDINNAIFDESGTFNKSSDLDLVYNIAKRVRVIVCNWVKKGYAERAPKKETDKTVRYIKITSVPNPNRTISKKCQSITPPGRYLLVDEAANLLRVSRRKVYSLIKNSEIQTFKIGTGTRIMVDSLHAYINRQVADTNPESIKNEMSYADIGKAIYNAMFTANQANTQKDSKIKELTEELTLWQEKYETLANSIRDLQQKNIDLQKKITTEKTEKTVNMALFKQNYVK